MKYISIIVLAIFVNFTALPSIAAMFDWEIPTAIVTIAEEEVQTGSSFNEKVTQHPLNIHDFIKFFELDLTNENFNIVDVAGHISPYIPIFSPPPNLV